MKQRFARIFDQKKKRHGFAAMATVLAATVLIGTCVACTAKPESLQMNVSSQPVSSASEPASSASKSDSASSANIQATSGKSNQTTVATVSKSATASQTGSIAQKTKDYLLNGQNSKSEAEKLKWSETFLNQVNIDSVYQKYLSAGGKANDVQSFADYLTKNAPIANNWKMLFEADLLKAYGEKPAQYESLQDNLYRVYVKKDGAEVPYVTVNARTGYFHG